MPKDSSVTAGATQSARTAASPSESAGRTAAQSTRTPGIAASTGRNDIAADATPYATTHRVLRFGRSSGQGRRALPTRCAGEPVQRSPAGTSPCTADPAAISAPRPILAPGNRVLRDPTAASAPMWTAPSRSTSPSSQ